MTANRKEKLKLILACVLSVFFIYLSVLTMGMAADFILLEEAVPYESIPALLLMLFNGLLKTAILVFGIGVLSTGALAAFFACSLKSHENPKIGKPMKCVYISDLCFLGLDILSIAILLL